MCSPVSLGGIVFIRHTTHALKSFAAPLGTALLFLALNLQSTAAQTKPDDLTQMSIETLMKMKVSSVAKKEQKISQTAAAIYVITQEDIRRSGMTSVPELLRMVPGLDVARIDSSEWAISARGFNSRLSKKLLVLVDGRSLYWPAYGNVYWETQNFMLEDIERIEVIRGPGATLWGTNAVNGVINIITKASQHTQGVLVSGSAGTQERGIGAVRVGRRVGGKGHYRIYAQGLARSELIAATGEPGNDNWHDLRSGFRTDWELSKRDTLTVQGDLYRGVENRLYNLISLTPPVSSPIDLRTAVQGGNLLGRWSRTYSQHSDMSLQVYYDSDTRDSFVTGSSVRTAGFDFQHRFALGERHDLLWGAGYRHAHDSFRNTWYESFLPAMRNDSHYDAFLEDEITLIRDRLRVTAAIRFEHVPYTGYDTEPNVRLLWTPSEKQSMWFSVSTARPAPTRATRESRAATDVSLAANGPPSVRTRFGSSNFVDENIVAFDAGYRIQPNHHVSLDLATFYNQYENLQTIEPGASFLELSPAPAHMVVPRYYANLMHGKGYGGEILLGWKVASGWKLNASYSFLRLELKRDPESRANNPESAEGNSPRHQAQLRSEWNLSKKFDFDQSLYFVSGLPSQAVPAYTRVDLRFGWRPTERIELSIVGQNLLSAKHEEFQRSTRDIPVLDTRKAYVKFTWKF